MQGESDAEFTKEVADAYQANLKRLMDLIRASLRVDDLPVAIGRISNSADAKAVPKNIKVKRWKFAKTVRKAQADFVTRDGHAALVTSTDTYSYSDPYHYDSAGFLDLGKAFADALETVAPRADKK
jgi:hypothetical protein